MDAAEVIVDIVSTHVQISKILIVAAQRPPLLQERTKLSIDEERIIESALSIREEQGLPFWDAVLLKCLHSENFPTRILREASFHNRSAELVSWVCRDDLRADHLRELNQRFPDRLIMISSLVELYDSAHAHIPMLDFHIPATEKNLSLVDIIVRELSPGGGFILESGYSYHFYGDWLLTEHDFMKFLGRALQYAPIIDRSWVAHQLIESACRLRILGLDDQITPQVIKRV